MNISKKQKRKKDQILKYLYTMRVPLRSQSFSSCGLGSFDNKCLVMTSMVSFYIVGDLTRV